MADAMTQDEIRAILDRNVARAWEVHQRAEARRVAERAEARRAAERATLASAPRNTAPPAPALSKPRIGPRMRQVADYVSAVPGCSKREATRAVGAYYNEYHGERGPVERAIDAGLIIAEYAHAKRCRLFATERDRERWHLARELLRPGIATGRVAQIRAEISLLDAERAATWSEPALITERARHQDHRPC